MLLDNNQEDSLMENHPIDIESIYHDYRSDPSQENMDQLTMASEALIFYYAKLYGGGYSFEDLPEFNSKTKAKSPVSFGIKGDFACCTEYKNVVTWKLPYQSEILAAAAL